MFLKNVPCVINYSILICLGKVDDDSDQQKAFFMVKSPHF